MATPAEVEPRAARRRRTDVRIDREPPPQPSIPIEAVQLRAYELFLERGGAHGADVDDWLRAERELGGRAES